MCVHTHCRNSCAAGKYRISSWKEGKSWGSALRIHIFHSNIGLSLCKNYFLGLLYLMILMHLTSLICFSLSETQKQKSQFYERKRKSHFFAILCLHSFPFICSKIFSLVIKTSSHSYSLHKLASHCLWASLNPPLSHTDSIYNPYLHKEG